MKKQLPSGICLHDVLALAQRLKIESGFEDNAAYDAALRALTSPVRPVTRHSPAAQDLRARSALHDRRSWALGDRRSSASHGLVRHLRGKRRSPWGARKRTLFRKPL